MILKVFVFATIVCVSLPCGSFAQQTEDPDPKELWQQYMQFKPSTKELAESLRPGNTPKNLREPFRTFAYAEVSTRDDLAAEDIVNLIGLWEAPPEPYGAMLWERFKAKATDVQLLKASNHLNLYCEKARAELASRIDRLPREIILERACWDKPFWERFVFL